MLRCPECRFEVEPYDAAPMDGPPDTAPVIIYPLFCDAGHLLSTLPDLVAWNVSHGYAESLEHY